MKYIICAVMLVTGIGMAYAECPEGYAFNTALKKCEIAPNCPPGFVLHAEDDFCSKKSSDGKCPDSSTYNQAEQTCEAELICPQGTVFVPDIDKCLKK